jgi:hypothetical protein
MAGRRRAVSRPSKGQKARRPAIQFPNAKYWRTWTNTSPVLVTRSHQWHWNLRPGSVLVTGAAQAQFGSAASTWPNSLLSPDSWRAWRFPLAPESVSLSPEHHAHALPPVALTSWFGPFPCQHFRHRALFFHPPTLSIASSTRCFDTFLTQPRCFLNTALAVFSTSAADLRFDEKAGNAELRTAPKHRINTARAAPSARLQHLLRTPRAHRSRRKTPTPQEDQRQTRVPGKQRHYMPCGLSVCFGRKNNKRFDPVGNTRFHHDCIAGGSDR